MGEKGRARFRRATEARASGRAVVESGGAPRSINSWAPADRRCGGRLCSPPSPPAAWGGEERSERAGGWGWRTRVSWWRRQEAEGEEPRRGVEGGGRERAEGGGHHCSPRRALCRCRRFGGWGSVGRRERGALRGAAVLFPLFPVERLELLGRPRLPWDAWPTAAAAAAASPRPCQEGTRRCGLRLRGEQVRARAAAAGGRERGGRGEKALPSRVPPPPHPRLVPVLFPPGCAEGFPEAVAVTTARSRGTGLSASDNVGKRDLEKGDGALRVCPRGAQGAGQGCGKRLRTPSGGMG